MPHLPRRLVLLALTLLLPLAAAQAPDAPAAEVQVEDDTLPALAAIGVDAGFPAHQTLALRGSLQARWAGAALRLGWGPGSGLSAGATLRGYPPLPGVPVPLWVGGGVSATGAGATPFVAAGAHVPVAQRVRLDLEAGVAFPELLDRRTTAPHLAVGVSYAFPVRIDPDARRGAAGDSRDRRAGARCEPTPPEPDRLDAALDATVRSFVADARATYGSLYDRLSYSVRLRSSDVDGDEAELRVAYSGSVREIATGERISASGDAEVSFRWDGCGWRRTGLSY